MMKWFGWGDPKIHFEISERPGVKKYLQTRFGLSEVLQGKRAWNINDVRVGDCSIPQKIIEKIEEKVGDTGYSVKKEDRILHAFGKSYKDLIRIRTLRIDVAPDIIFFPKKEADLVEIFSLCQSHGIAVVPFSGGTGVVGGLDALKGKKRYAASLDLTRLNRILEFDEVSHTVTVEGGISGVALEKELNTRGFTLGHFPQSFEYTTVGGWVATRSSGQNSLLYGNIEKMVVSLKMVTPSGAFETARAPAMACGPDLKELFIGSEGVFGVIYSCTLRIRPLPEKKEYFALLFRSFDEATKAAKTMVQSGLKPAMIRVSDEEETESMVIMSGTSKGTKKILRIIIGGWLKLRGFSLAKASMMMIGLEGSKEENLYIKKRIRVTLRGAAYCYLGKRPGDKWLRDRFKLPYMRDFFLDNKLLVDTLETATTWNRVQKVYDSVCKAIREVCGKQGVRVAVYAHISHLYETGASIYFTIVANQIESRLLGQWGEIKEAASRAIVGHGGVISHHHGIGLDHKPYIKRSKSELAILRAIKNVLDPEGIMNPEKLFD